MTVNFNLQGAERKPLVKAISEILGAEATYLKTPSYAYQIGEYYIDRYGVLTGPDNYELTIALRQALRERSSITEAEMEAIEAEIESDIVAEMQAEMDATEAAYEEEFGRLDEHYPGSRSNPDAPITEFMHEQMAQVEAEWDAHLATDRFTVEMPLEGFTPEKLENLSRLVKAKEELLKAALGAEALPIQITENTIRFPWFEADGILSGGEEVEPYTTLISLLCETAKEKKRVTAKPGELPENPKYAMRCWLLSLGFIGAEYAKSRKVLLSKLDGNSSWKNGKPEQN